MSEGFRLDINGLRAWAVVAVVLYHFGVPGFSGGFVGVDVFFVISGFLMAGIVTSGLRGGRFSLWQFYLARARRILPALIVLGAAVLMLGAFLLLPSEYRALGGNVRASLLFISNLHYLDMAGYFSAGAHSNWLLHTWSLSVEWQFYLLLPVFAMAVWRWSGRSMSWLGGGHAFVLLLSFAYCVYLTGRNPEAAFFMLQSRAWELLVGAVVYFAVQRHTCPEAWRAVLVHLGLGMVAVSVGVFTPESVWPGGNALLPVLGAAMVIVASHQRGALTASAPAQWLGTRSYSLYLWHWPLVVVLDYFGVQGQPVWVLAALLLTLLLGHLSYVGIEVPSRQRLARQSAWQSTGELAVLLLAVAGCGHWLGKSGWPGRLPAEVVAVDAASVDRNPRRNACLKGEASCVYGGPQVAAVLLGDSHGDAVVNAVAAAVPDPARQGVLFKGVRGCPTLLGTHRVKGGRDICGEWSQTLEQVIEQLPAQVPVVIVNRATAALFGGVAGEDNQRPGVPGIYFSRPYEHPEPELLEEYRQAYLATACRISRRHPLYLVQPIPEMGRNVPVTVGRGLLWGARPAVDIPLTAYQQRHAFVLSVQREAVERCGAILLDPLPHLCRDGSCPGEYQGRPIYYDDDHLNEFGNRILVPMFRGIFTATSQ